MKIKTHFELTMSDPVPALRAVAGNARRAAALYGQGGFELRHERDDVNRKETTIDRIREVLVFQELGREYLERLFGVGGWHCTTHRFDRATCIHYTEGEFSGVFVSVDSGTDVDLEKLADACHSSEA